MYNMKLLESMYEELLASPSITYAQNLERALVNKMHDKRISPDSYQKLLCMHRNTHHWTFRHNYKKED